MRATLIRCGTSLLLAATLGACAARPDFVTPPVAPGSVPSDTIGGAWWRGYGSPQLNALVREALSASPTLLEARMRLAQAQQEYLAQAGGTQWPQADLSLNANRKKINPAALAGGVFGGNPELPPFTLYHAGVNVTYALDLFGANRMALEGLGAYIDVQQQELEAARLTLAGNVVTTVILHASLAAQIALSDAMLIVQERQLAIARERFKAGGIAEQDLLARRGLVDHARAAIAPLRTRQAQAAHQLAVYLGRWPARDAGTLPSLEALALPAALPLTVPAALARQRPDIRAAEALLHQAGANVGVATANLYPQITLNASFGKEGTGVGDMISIWSLGAGIMQPLWHGGQLRARQRAAQDAYEAAAAAYRQTVLQGLQQVADALRALEQDALELDARDHAIRNAAATARIAQARQLAGGLSELDRLDAQGKLLQSSLERTRIQAQRLADSAALYQAIGARP
jgi:NodT family efflux transporter outer membrane factor (OMF) lipoprotein